MYCLWSFISGSVCMTSNMKGICSWLTINWFRPSRYSLLLSRKYNCVALSLLLSLSCVMIINFRKCMLDKKHENMMSNVSAMYSTYLKIFKLVMYIYLNICIVQTHSLYGAFCVYHHQFWSYIIQTYTMHDEFIVFHDLMNFFNLVLSILVPTSQLLI